MLVNLIIAYLWSFFLSRTHVILAFITPNTYLSNPSFRGMRQSLIKSFDDIYILDLHGYYTENCPDGSPDKNVFDIKQGVSISIFVKKNRTNLNLSNDNETVNVFHKHLFGLREVKEKNTNNRLELTGGKYYWLENNDLDTTDWITIQPDSPHYLFIPQDQTLRNEYEKGVKLTDIFPVNSTCIKTHRDKFVIDFQIEKLEKRIIEFCDLRMTDIEIKNKYKLKDTRDWKLSSSRKLLKDDKNSNESFSKILYRPFDKRSYFNNENVVELPRQEVMQHLDRNKNLGLLFNRQIKLKSVQHSFVSNIPTDFHILETANASVYIAPLYLYPTEKKSLFDEEIEGRKPNFSDEFIKEFSDKLKLEFNPNPENQKPTENQFTPEDVFYYAYAVFHSPTYRSRYAEFLKIDFPRLPLTSNLGFFRELTKHGERLTELHLLEEDIETDVTFPEKGSNKVEFSPKYKDEKVYINKDQYFENVPENAWNFHIGGYQVLHKWLKDRKDRELSFDELEHYAKVVSALSNTIELMQKIDETIEENGGFPFQIQFPENINIEGLEFNQEVVDLARKAIRKAINRKNKLGEDNQN